MSKRRLPRPTRPTRPPFDPLPALPTRTIRGKLPRVPAQVTITAEAQAEYARLPLAIRPRVAAVFARLADWPTVSGAKPLRGDLKGSFRIRTGDYRVVFRVEPSPPAPPPGKGKPKRAGKGAKKPTPPPAAPPEGAPARVTVWRIGYRGDVYD